jgi:hypothetical protein
MNLSRYRPAALVAVLLVTTAGCGPSLKKVKGVVKLDGTPVEGATVAFVSSDGITLYSGFTDQTGTFTLSTPDGKEGVPPGTYKVTVVKHAAMQGGEGGAGSPEYTKMMEKSAKEAAKESAGSKGGMMPGMPRGGGTSHEKTELPKIYASATSTPISVTVPPPSSDPVAIELKSKP